MGKVLSVNLSTDKQKPKRAVPLITVDIKKGVIGDAHEGAPMQVSILPYEAVERELGDTKRFPPGSFAENITTQGVDFSWIRIGDIIKIGEVILRVVQIGKPSDQSHTYSFKGYSLLPRYGIFANVITPGKVSAGDEIFILSP